MDIKASNRPDPLETLLSIIQAAHSEGYRLLQIQLNSLGAKALNASQNEEVHNFFEQDSYHKEQLFKVILTDGTIAKTEILYTPDEFSGVRVQEDSPGGVKIWMRLPPPFNTVVEQA